MMFWIKVRTTAAGLFALLVGILTAFAVKAAAGSVAPQPAVAIAPAAPATEAAAPLSQPTAPQAGATTITADGGTLPEIISQIHNAPEWKGGAAYTPGDRVVNLKETPAGAYECIRGGTSGDPAPQGQGGSVNDGGGVVWRYLSDVDYTSITGWAYDAARWKSGAAYLKHDLVAFGTPLCSYRCGHAGDGPSTVDPSVTGATYEEHPAKGYQNPAPGADGYLWENVATIGYSSGKSFIPTQRDLAGPWAGPWGKQGRGPGEIVQLMKNYTAVLWNDREYIAGQNGENHPITLENHETYCPHDDGSRRSTLNINLEVYLKVTAAPGESFMDHPDAPLRFSRANGVAIYNPSGGMAVWGHSPGDGISMRDNHVILDRLQIRSAHADALGDCYDDINHLRMSDCIFQSDGPTTAVEVGASCSFTNCLLIGSGRLGIWDRYPVLLDHCTIVAATPSAAASIGVDSEKPWYKPFCDGMTVITNSAFFGWTYAAAHGAHKMSPDWWNPQCANNATDTAATLDQPNPQVEIHGWDAYGPGGPFIVNLLPGTGNHFNVPFDKTTFRDPGADWCLVPNSPLKGIGIQLDSHQPYPHIPDKDFYEPPFPIGPSLDDK